MDYAYFTEGPFSRLVEKGLSAGIQVIIILALAMFAVWFSKQATKRLKKTWHSKMGLGPEALKRSETLSHLLNVVLKTLIWIFAGMMILGQLGFQLGPILAAAGIGGLAIGFGAQTLVKDFLSGFFLLIENQIRVGDVVKVAGESGLVEKITLRTLTLRDIQGNVHIIPHGSIEKVNNMTKELVSDYLFDVGVAYKEDTDRVTEVLKRVGDEMMQDPVFSAGILAPLEILGVDSFQNSSVQIKARIKTKPIQQWAIGREMNRRIKKAFESENIEIPFPHRVIIQRSA